MNQFVNNYTFPYNKREVTELPRTTEKLINVSNFGSFLVEKNGLDDLIERASGYIIDLFYINYCKIVVYEQNGTYESPQNDVGLMNVLGSILARINNQSKNQWFTSADHYLTRDEKTSLGLSDNDCHLVLPLNVEEHIVGFILMGKNSSHFNDTFPDDSFYMIDLITDQLAHALHRKQLNEAEKDNSVDLVLALSKTMESRDSKCGSHCKRMAAMCKPVAERFNFSERETRELCWAALLHDIGKIGIEDHILHKPGPLNFREWDIIKTHPEIGATIIRGLSGLENIAPMVLSHHEHLDGSGYPHGLRGDEINLGARILSVVDAYCAMTENRDYRPSLTHEQALDQLNNLSGIIYDPVVVSRFIEYIGLKVASDNYRLP